MEKLKYIFDHAKVGIAICNVQDNRLEMVNPAFAHIHGYEPHELIGVSPGEVFAPECMQRLQVDENTSSCAIEDVSFETTHVRKDGSLVPVSVHITVIKDENGVVKQRIANIIDISKRKKAESELQITNERFSQIYNNSTDIIYLIKVTPEGRFIHLDINPAYIEASSMAREEIVKCYIDEFENEPFRTILLDKYTSCLKAGKRIDYTNDYPLPSGIKTFHSVLTPLFNENGRIHQIVGIARDITKQKEQEELLRMLTHAINSSNESFFLIKAEQPDFYYVNDTAAKTLEYSKEELTNGMGVFDIDPDFNNMDMWIEHVKMLEKCNFSTFETRHRSKEGRIYPVEVNSNLFIYNNERFIFSTSQDITKQKETENALFTHEREFRNLSENSPNIIIRYDRDCRQIYVNQAYAYQTGTTVEKAINSKPEDEWDTHLCLLTINAQEYQERIQQVIDSGEADYFTIAWYRLSDGAYVVHEFYLSVERDVDENSIGVLAIGHDITEHKRLIQEMQQNESRLKEAQKIAKVGSWELEFPSGKLTWSDEIYRIFEIEKNDQPPLYADFLNALHPEDRELVNLQYSESLKNKTPHDVTHRLLLSDGRIKYLHEKGVTHYDKDGNPLRSIGTTQDVTEEKSIEKKIEFLAHHDALTGLPNRILAKDRTDQSIAHAKRNNTQIALLFIDLDEFKVINDSLGHSAGDTTLQIISSRLRECIRECDIVSRQGGDEFLIILSDITEAKDIITITEKLLQEFEKPFLINEQPFSTSASIGIATYPANGNSFELLLKNADIAMYKAKESGKNTYCFYTEQMNHNLIGQFKLQNDLKDALVNEEFVLFYQPQIDLVSNRITGAEALIRWQHPHLGMMPPMSFIPIAESSGLIVQIGEWVIYEACRQAAAWHTMGIEITVAVNISAVQFKRGNLENVVINALKTSGLHPCFLELELTESILINDVENILKTVQALKGLGLQLSIDDFGTGYSSLAYLKRFSVDKLKIDQSFVHDILKDPEDAAIVRAIIQMAKSLNLKTIAEGVEDKEVLSLIESYACDEVQGYHFAKPMKITEFETYYHQYTANVHKDAE